jgi:hypothetical protein
MTFEEALTIARNGGLVTHKGTLKYFVLVDDPEQGIGWRRAAGTSKTIYPLSDADRQVTDWMVCSRRPGTING